MSNDPGYCIKCGLRVASVSDFKGCPNCGEEVPCFDTHEISININIRELQALCLFAEGRIMALPNEYEQARAASILSRIVRKLKSQFPDTHHALSLAESIKILRDKGHVIDVPPDFIDLGIDSEPPA